MARACAQAGPLAVDAPVAPARLVPSRFQRQRPDVRGRPGSSAEAGRVLPGGGSMRGQPGPGADEPGQRGSAAEAGRVLPDEVSMQAQQGPGRDDQVHLAELAAGQQPGQRGRDAWSSQDGPRVLTWCWSTATWWGAMRIPASLVRSDRA